MKMLEIINRISECRSINDSEIFVLVQQQKMNVVTITKVLEQFRITVGLAAVLDFIACLAGTIAQFINKKLKLRTNV